jgi:chemotaxis protein methyltransferase CheR
MNFSVAEFRPDQFRQVSELMHRISGIHLHSGKRELVRARLTTRMRELRLADFDSYLSLLSTDRDGRELACLVDLLTTNKTSFFREPQHFHVLRERVLPELGPRAGPLRVWSAGCSTGEEPYSLALALNSELGSSDDARILATDISARVLEIARHGVYPEDALRDVPPALRQAGFHCVSGRPPRSYVVAESIRSMVHFARLNLVGEWPMRGPFDLICCRNVMIYFARPTQQRLVERFFQLLVPGGYFFAGHSESFAGLEHGFQYVQPAVYRRPA